MNPQIWWYIARASGIIAWLFITAAVLWGILLSTKLFPEHRRPAWLLDLHRMLGALSVLFLATHVGALIADSYIQFDIVDILVPFASEWKTWQVALGVFAFWGVVIVEATSLAMKRLPKKVWRPPTMPSPAHTRQERAREAAHNAGRGVHRASAATDVRIGACSRVGLSAPAAAVIGIRPLDATSASRVAAAWASPPGTAWA